MPAGVADNLRDQAGNRTVLINHWYVLAESAQLGDAPLGARALGQDFALFRDTNGRACCVANVCVHKGGSLCHGEVVDGTIQCPYHGWRYDRGGQCVAIPALGPEQRIPGRARVDAYPVVEQWGWIWVFLGDLPESERPPLPDFFPEYEQQLAGWRFVRDRAQFDCNWVRAIENGVDRTHAIFVHTAFGNPANPVQPGYEVESSEHRLYARASRVPLDKQGAWREAVPDKRGERQTEVQIHVPAPCIRIQMHMQPPVSQIIVTAYTPLDAGHTRLHFIHARNFLADAAHDADTLGRVHQVLAEDAAVLNHLQPTSVPPALADELLLASDRHGIEYRRRVMAAEALGYAIDTAALARNGDRAHAIPCPRRREDPANWVLPPVPLKPAT
jgi:phenylpropionate dioxygenase-like ring-hydroxylating dioxygenase large terminal subunit